jgi:dihydrofolate synthase/folylpolyglutamate synthase
VRLIDRTPGPDGQSLHLRTARRDYPGLVLPLLGEHQASNARVALAAVEAFLGADDDSLDAASARRALGRVSAPGRLERVRDTPPVLLDASHNPAGMAVSVQGLREGLSATRLVVVLAVLNGKDVDGILHALADVASVVVVTQNDSPRHRPAEDLAVSAVTVLGSDRVVVEPRMEAAIDEALRLARPRLGEPTDRPAVLVTGSVVTAGQARSLLVR